MLTSCAVLECLAFLYGTEYLYNISIYQICVFVLCVLCLDGYQFESYD